MPREYRLSLSVAHVQSVTAIASSRIWMKLPPESVDFVTILEVCEHLTQPETEEIIDVARS
jgi:hypothetical protein